MDTILNKKHKVIIFALLFAVIFFTGISSNFSLVNSYIAKAVEKPEPLILNWLQFDEGILKAEKENKIILIQFFADGCSWCKKMEKEVYPNEEVKKILLEKFIIIKVNGSSNNKIVQNGEEITEKKLAALFQVTGYPTTWFLEDKDKGIAPLPGYVPAEQFVTVLKYIGEEWYKKITFQEYVENNES
ncbi:MAG: thioredoxin fold domain-containing protein [Candidatus Caldatribacteriota bacterium]|nr:thioredoxin fold domain-containing protein [Candidatus Caldatribacteriota bacterium]